MLDKNGDIRWFLSRGQAIDARNRLIGTAIDITDRKRDEDERVRTLDRLAEQQNELAHLGRAAMVCPLREEHPHRFSVRIEAAVLREKRIDEDDRVIGLAQGTGAAGSGAAWRSARPRSRKAVN